MRCMLILLLGLSALLNTSAVNRCLDPTNADYKCELDIDGELSLISCSLMDDDLDDIASCMDDVGRDNIVRLYLGANDLTTLPEGIFGNLTSLETLYLDSSGLTTLPEGIFGDLTSLTGLYLSYNGLTTLPEGIFGDVTSLTRLYLDYNGLTTLPEGIFGNLTSLTGLSLSYNGLTTLPEGIFGDVTSLTGLYLDYNGLTTLPEGIFGDLTSLTGLYLDSNGLTTLPEGIFGDLTSLTRLDLDGNDLECLPVVPSLEEVIYSITYYNYYDDGIRVDQYGDECGCSTANVTNVCGQGRTCTAGEFGYTCEGTLTPAPAPTPTEAPAPTTPASATAPNPSPQDDTPVIAGVVSAVAAAVLIGLGFWLRRRRNRRKGRDTSQPLPTTSRDLESDPGCGPHEGTGSGTAVLLDDGGHPTAPYDEGPSHPPDAPTEADVMASDDEGILLTSEPEPAEPAAPRAPAVDGDGAAALAMGDTLEKPALHKENVSPHQDTPVEGSGIVPPSAPASLDGQELPRAEHAEGAQSADGSGHEKPPSHEDTASPHPHKTTEAGAVDRGDAFAPSAPPALVAKHNGVRLAGESNATGGSLPAPTATPAEESGVVGLASEENAEDAAGGVAKKSLETATSFATVSTANMSAAEQEEVAQFRQRQLPADAAPVAGGPTQEGEALVGGVGGIGASSSSASRQGSASHIGLGQAVLAAAQELARSCQIPGVSEAAGAVCIMANLFTDSRDSDQASKSRLRQCRSIVLALKRADEVVGKGGDTMGEAARVLIEDVHDAIFDLVELIKTFQSKNKLSKLFLSTLFKRRQDELDAVVNQAILRLQLGLQLQAGHDMSSMKDSMKSMEDDVSAVKDGVKAVEEGMHLSRQGSTAEATSESVAEARRIRRQRKLDQIEIPEEHLFITDDVLGKGGFGEVYLADYNGHNAAAKVLYIGHDLGALDENQKQRETRQRRAFLRELEAMIRLRSPNTVNIFGAVTCLPDRMVLVMELLPNGDLLTLLKKSKNPLPEKQARRIIGDICAGMAFLHSKNTVHGDLKSANVLLDGDDRAKIADFGTSRWTQSTNTTGLATYTTKSNQTTQMSIAWSAPEVLESEGSSYESDVYSFGIVTWEVISRELPWAKKARPRDILTAVWRGDRPSFPVDAPPDIVDIAKACWCAEPKGRTTFSAILEGMKAGEWGDE